MLGDGFANIYVIHHFPYARVETDSLSHIYVRSGISPEGSKSLSADVEDNIANENPLYAEFSTFYWVWKNQMQKRYTGFFHYRRYISINDNVANQNDITAAINSYGWNDLNIKNFVENYDVILPTPVVFSGSSVRQQYYQCHGTLYLDMALDIISKKYPDYLEDCTRALDKDSGYFCNLFIMRTDLFNQYMNWIMDIFSELKVITNPDPNVKSFAYLGERLFNCYLEHLIRVGNIRIKVNPWILVQPRVDGGIDFLVN